MNVNDFVQQLKQQRSRLDAAIQALEGTNRRGRPPGSTNKSSKRRTMSAAARKRISAAMKKRWAERKKARK
jgi:hypothetical protein